MTNDSLAISLPLVEQGQGHCPYFFVLKTSSAILQEDSLQAEHNQKNNKTLETIKKTLTKGTVQYYNKYMYYTLLIHNYTIQYTCTCVVHRTYMYM